MTRIKAFLIHLGISALIFFFLLYFIIFHWYPSFLFASDGGWQGVRIIAAVDLVLGPLLTLIVYKAGKPSLKMDLSIIALIQVAALTWGVWVTYNERPYAIVFTEYYFLPVSKHQFEEDKIPVSKIDNLSKNSQPRMIYTNLPVGSYEKMSKLRREARETQLPLYLWHDLYDNFKTEYIPTMRSESFDLDFILSRDDKFSESIRQKLTHYAKLKNDFLFFLIRTRSRRMMAIFDTRTFKITDTINFDPTRYLDIIRTTENKSDKSH